MKLPRKVKHAYQKVTRGFSDGETYSLDQTIAKFVLPRLQRFKEVNNGFPYGMTAEEWDVILDDMIYAMQVHAKGLWDASDDTNWECVERGLLNFGKHFRQLWW